GAQRRSRSAHDGVTPMKRAFLFGLGTSGGLLTIYAFFLSALYTFVAGQAPPLEFPLTVLFLIVFSVSSIWFAYRAPPNRSRLHAVFGWLLGVIVTCVMIAVYLAVSLSDDPRMRTAPDAARASSHTRVPDRGSYSRRQLFANAAIAASRASEELRGF